MVVSDGIWGRRTTRSEESCWIHCCPQARRSRHTRHHNWRAVLVLDGDMLFGDEKLTKDDLLVMEPSVSVPAFEVGAQGVHLVEFARTAAAVAWVCREEDRQNPTYAEGLAAIPDAGFV